MPPPQANVAPAVVEDAVSVSKMLLQVKIDGGAIVELGATMFWVTLMVAELVQPFDGSVAMTV